MTIETPCNDAEKNSPPASLMEIPDDLIDGLIEALTCPAGRQLLVKFLTDVATVNRLHPRDMRNEDFVAKTHYFDSVPENEKNEFFAKIRGAVKSFLGSSSGVTTGNDSTSSASMLALAAGILKNLGVKLPPQAAGVIDNLIDKNPPQMGVAGHAPGLIAGVVAFAISAYLNSSQYQEGMNRWDDAIDNVVGDTVKAGLTGVVLSLIAGSLSPAPPGALAAVLVLAPVIYAIIDGFVNVVYMRLLGVEQILDARKIHIEYLEVASFIRNDILPRLRKMNEIGNLVDILGQLKSENVNHDQVKNSARKTLKSLGILVKNSPKNFELDNEYKEELKKYFRNINADLEALLTGTAPLSIDEIAHFNRCVHQFYWRKYAVDQGFARPGRAMVIRQISDKQGITGLHDPRRSAAIERLIGHFADIEYYRSSVGEPILFETSWNDQINHRTYLIRASDVLELVRIVLIMKKQNPWPLMPLLENPDWTNIEPEAPNPATYAGLVQYPPGAVGGVLNKFYSKNLFDGLQRGRYRLFKYSNPNIEAYPINYIAACATEDSPEAQCDKLRQSLQRLHPAFVGAAHLLNNLSVVKVKDDGSDDLTMFGLRVFVVDLYTATYRVEANDIDNLGRTFYVSHEGYFRTRAEAQNAFTAIILQHTLIGVRPGPKILSDQLREQLRTVKGEQLFSLQNQLLGRLAEGLIALDEVSNLTEERIAKLAGSGVFLSWWWTFSGRLRRELVLSLKDELIKQALRVELMEALLQVQRLHILSHDFFHDTLYTALAKVNEKEIAEFTNIINNGLHRNP
ncbi:MAG: hypothetical protein ACOYMW_06475 [Candidatus Competibacteraceae bacterium]